MALIRISKSFYMLTTVLSFLEMNQLLSAELIALFYLILWHAKYYRWSTS